MSAVRAATDALLDAIVQRRVEDVVDSYARSPGTYVFVEGPRWSTLGSDAVERGWRAWHASGLRMTDVRWVEGPFEGGDGSLAWLAGIVEVDAAGAPPAEPRTLRLRASYVLAREGDRWRVVHEHVSQPVSDPYGSGDWLPVPGA